MDINILAAILLVAHLLSTGFITIVIVRQLKLFKIKVQQSLVRFRHILFILALVVFVGNLVPIGVDFLTIVNIVERMNSVVNPVGVAYSVSNAIVFVTSALLIWVLYRMAAVTVLITKRDKEIERAKIEVNK